MEGQIKAKRSRGRGIIGMLEDVGWWRIDMFHTDMDSETYRAQMLWKRRITQIGLFENYR